MIRVISWIDAKQWRLVALNVLLVIMIIACCWYAAAETHHGS